MTKKFLMGSASNKEAKGAAKAMEKEASGPA
jgi:hypothetical protein